MPGRYLESFLEGTCFFWSAWGRMASHGDPIHSPNYFFGAGRARAPRSGEATQLVLHTHTLRTLDIFNASARRSARLVKAS